MRDRDPDLTGSRKLLEERRIAPIWQSATDGMSPDDPDLETVRRGARSRVLRYLADYMGLHCEEADPASFSLEECREAWVLLTGTTYADVRAWATQYRAPPIKTGAAA
ncbi:hypothetical protein NS228_06000 [Methylobacterium indicum]|uniref:hypothetical protein n=1 Tax=Methylobacterium indicum TaxID=1775910 RepID=UPI00073417CF|nr:hypothetical protein [Methylobacterium indicum]KTS30896.1 hypothetical protein NS229_14835 [Methylobacterium indicum]KTS41517.1 hypothetical protein NS228_06000 [Methylobacterium indicum]KTS52429.1 hypothetical protein NS230_09915 [Methylobacterium indicum]